MKFQKCYKVPRAKEIKESYVVKEGYINANVDRESIGLLIYKFLLAMDEPSVMFLEVPCGRDKELELRKSDSDPLHRDLYYMEFETRESAVATWCDYRDILLNCGACYFGFFSGNGSDRIEIGIYKYNEVYLHYSEVMFERIKRMLDSLDIPQVDELVTAWENFSEEKPGQTKACRIKGWSIYDMIDELEEYGLYHDSVVED